MNKSDEQREITAKLSISYDKYYPNKKIVKLIALQLASSGRYHPKLMSSDYFSPQSDWADVHLLLIPNTFNDPIFIYYQLALLTGLGNRMRLQKYLSVLSRYFSGMISRQAFNERAIELFSEAACFLPIGRLSSAFFIRNTFPEEGLRERILNVLLER